MTEQDRLDLKFLYHLLDTNEVKIKGLVQEISDCHQIMRNAIASFLKGFSDETDN